ncbi:MAG: molybdopterin molybdotransferase MoeA [Polaromonas sp.]|nr:molybdopterin molybdotransferase MoeA [Polaromonas sp.]
MTTTSPNATTASATAKPMKALKPLDDALAELLGFAAAMDGHDVVSTFEADHRVLAEDLVSQLDVPAHDNSAMDGYAVRRGDIPSAGVTLAVSQRIPAGSVGQTLAAGTVARIFTGAPVPEGADAVVMQEDCDVLDSGPAGQPQVRVNTVPPAGQHIRRRGEDIASGAVVLKQGTRLTPAELGLAASMGFDTLKVARPVRVALFSTGDELVMPGQVAPADLKPGAIYNSNRFVLRALLLRLGCVVTDLGIVPDQLDATVAALKGASETHDLILTSGGVSVGEEDHVKPAVQTLGDIHLWQMAVKPGKPFAYGQVAGTHFIGLPGNPVSSFVTFLLLVRPFLLKLQGAADLVPLSLPMAAHFTLPKADRRREFLRVRRNAAGGLDLFSNQSSGVLTSAVWGDGLVDNPAGRTVAHGDLVRFIPFSELLG